jgi:hypothetical protein
LVISRAGLLDTGLDGRNQVGLLAVASKVGKAGAAIGTQGIDEALKSTAGDISKLSRGNGGQSNGNSGE